MDNDLESADAELTPSGHTRAADDSRPQVMSDKARAARRRQVMEKFEAGKLISFDEFLAKRGL